MLTRTLVMRLFWRFWHRDMPQRKYKLVNQVTDFSFTDAQVYGQFKATNFQTEKKVSSAIQLAPSQPPSYTSVPLKG
jgi:hypothetical protein